MDILARLAYCKSVTDAEYLHNLCFDSAEVISRLRAAIQKTLDDNGHLADGDNCSLIELKRVMR